MSSERNSDRLKALVWIAYHLEAPKIVERYVGMVSDELQRRGHEVVVCRDADCVMQSIRDVDLMVCWRILPEMLASAPRLRWIQFGSAGIDHTLFPELLSSDVILTTLSGIHRTPVAEHVIGTMLALSKKLHMTMRMQTERRYERATVAATSEELWGKTVGIIGLGKIGLEIARLCKCFGMTVIGTKRRADMDLPNVDEVYSPAGLDKVLARSDYLVLVLPLTEDTRALLSDRELRLMKPSAYLINVARGVMVDQDALLSALDEGRLAGAALDVFTQEPLPPDSPLYDMQNVIITPHVAAAHHDYAERAFEVFKANLDAFEGGGAMINGFDRSRGY